MNGLQRLWQRIRDALGELEREYERALGPDVERPYPNEHACRLRDPDDFEDDSFVRTTRKHEGKKYSVIQARLTGEDTLTDQAFRYDKDTWKAGEARTHCKDHKGSFTAAKGEERALSIPAIYGQVQDALWNWEGEPLPHGTMPWLNDIYVDGDQLIAIISAGGKLYRGAVALDGTTVTLGTIQEVEIQFAPVRSRQLSIFRQADGRYRWFARACTAALNRVGEIDSRALFDSFVENAKTEGYPQLRFFHDARLLMGQADYLAREDAVLIASGLLDDGPLAVAFIDACEKGRGAWGTSDGFTATQPPEEWEVAEGVTIPVYHAGVLREISVLPENIAAAWFTAIDAEVTRMRKEVLDALTLLFGDEERVKELVEEVDQTNRAIQEAGLVTRDGAQDQGTASDPPAEPAAQVAPAEPAEIVLDDEALDAIAEKVKAVVPAVDLGPLQAALAGIEVRLAAIEGATETRQALTAIDGRLKALERTDDEKREQWKVDQPARKQLVVTHRPREERGAGDKKPSLAEIAEATLSKMPK